MQKISKLFFIFLLGLLLTGCQSIVTEQNGQTTTPVISEDSQKNYTLTADKDNVNGLELSKSELDLKYEETSFGVFIIAINGIEASDDYFWALYLNGNFAEQSVDKLNLNKGDKIEWRYEKING
jgi:hypothetical protein